MHQRTEAPRDFFPAPGPGVDYDKREALFLTCITSGLAPDPEDIEYLMAFASTMRGNLGDMLPVQSLPKHEEVSAAYFWGLERWDSLRNDLAAAFEFIRTGGPIAVQIMMRGSQDYLFHEQLVFCDPMRILLAQTAFEGLPPLDALRGSICLPLVDALFAYFCIGERQDDLARLLFLLRVGEAAGADANRMQRLTEHLLGSLPHKTMRRKSLPALSMEEEDGGMHVLTELLRHKFYRPDPFTQPEALLSPGKGAILNETIRRDSSDLCKKAQAQGTNPSTPEKGHPKLPVAEPRFRAAGDGKRRKSPEEIPAPEVAPLSPLRELTERLSSELSQLEHRVVELLIRGKEPHEVDTELGLRSGTASDARDRFIKKARVLLTSKNSPSP